jgi:glycolate oxidase FAD binding subunit
VSIDEAIRRFADDVGRDDPVTVTGAGTRGGGVAGVRTVRAPSGVDRVEPAEMIVSCGTGTLVADLDGVLAEHGQCVALPASGTVGGALASGASSLRRLGWGPARDTVLQVRYVSAAGDVVKAGGPTVKNVSGFDLCRLLVGSRGTLGFLADVILRTRPRPDADRWFMTDRDPRVVLGELYRPSSVLWNGTSTWVLLDGHPTDVSTAAARSRLEEVAGPPNLPPFRWSLPPASLPRLVDDPEPFVAEIGVGVVHHSRPAPARPVDPTLIGLHHRIKAAFDPTGRLNPGLDVLEPVTTPG